MNTAFYIITIGIIVLFTYTSMNSTSPYQLDVEEKLERLGLELVEFKLGFNWFIRNPTFTRFRFTARRPGEQTTYEGFEHDMDGSGHVDALELAALRAKIRAEVEAEREIAAPEAAPLPTKPPGSW